MNANFTATQSFEHDQLFELLDDLTARINVLEELLAKNAAGDRRVDLLLTHKGIGLLSALVARPYFRRRLAISIEQGSCSLHRT